MGKSMGFYIKLAGVTFDNKQFNISRLSVNQELILIREPNNVHDRFAVAVCTKSGEPLGYIPAANNGSIAYRMDRGGKYRVVVGAVTGGGYGQNYGLNVFIEEI